MEKCRGGNGGQKDFQKTEGEGPGFLCGASSYVWLDKEARFRKTRKTTAKMGGLCEERSEKSRGGRKVERKGQQQGPMETNYKSSRTSE